MVFFTLFLNLVKGESSTMVGVVGNFVRIALGGPVLGKFFLIQRSPYWTHNILLDEKNYSRSCPFNQYHICWSLSMFLYSGIHLGKSFRYSFYCGIGTLHVCCRKKKNLS